MTQETIDAVFNTTIEWWGIKVRKSDGSFHYVTDIPTDVAGVVEEFLDEIDDDNLEEEIK